MYSLIVIRNATNGIGNANSIPWRTNVKDLEFFKKITTDNVVIMGRKTWESIPSRPLQNRINIVITNQTIEGVQTFKSIKACDRFLHANHSKLKWVVIGGESIYNEYMRLNLVSEIYLSQLNSSEECDKHFNWTPNNKNSSLLYTDDKLKIYHFVVEVNTEELKLLEAMSDIIDNGFKRPNRTGVDTRAVFGKQFEYIMEERIDPNTGHSSFRLPLLTSKKMFTRGVFAELKWFLSGGTDSKLLERKGVNIWKGNTSKEYLESVGLDYDVGETGPIYGFQWRHATAKYIQGKHDYTGEGIDQVAQVIESLQNNPYSRRHIINAWAPGDLDKMVLPPCHILYQFFVHQEGDQKYLSLMMTQRSCDSFLGLPFNLCSLGMFLTLMAHRVGMKPYKIIHSIADMHIYETHIEAASEQVQRKPYPFPYIRIDCNSKERLEDYEFSDIKIEDYFHHDAIKADMVA